MNWDTVIEQKLSDVRGFESIDYKCGAMASSFPQNGEIIGKRNLPEHPEKMPVVKIHG